MVSPWMENGNIIDCMKYLRKINADIPREPWVRFYLNKLSTSSHELTTV